MAVGAKDIVFFIDESVHEVDRRFASLGDMEKGLCLFGERRLPHMDLIPAHALGGEFHIEERQLLAVKEHLIGILLPCIEVS